MLLYLHKNAFLHGNLNFSETEPSLQGVELEWGQLVDGFPPGSIEGQPDLIEGQWIDLATLQQPFHGMSNFLIFPNSIGKYLMSNE